MVSGSIDVAVTGDMVLDEPDAGYWLSGIAPALHSADLAIAHLEVPHTASGDELAGDVPAPGAPPENLAALAQAGVGMVSLAGNHISDCGAQGIADTIAGLDAAGVLYTGAGPDLAAARRPAIAYVKQRRIALLSYNCVGPENGWASASGAGCGYLPMGTGDGSPVTPQKDIASILPTAFEILRDDIAAARTQADVVIIAMHKGLVHRPAQLAPYERPLAQAAIDHGADAVIGHHAHIVKGIEFYRDRPIFHGLGNGCVVTSALSPDQDHPARAQWAQRRKALFGFEPDPEYRLAPFHPEAVNAFIGRLTLAQDGSVTAGLIPVHVEAPGRPVLADASRGREIAAYVERITRQAGLPAITVEEDYTVRAAS
ncbi:CapA family protein [Aurantiacibacter suaedae]|uniref:CapA family protein n=1 Tax=Aurantiacibacter suaedae TaxID=2545755 RepID=UPI0010F86EFA|nr:CapA family protein [Aurantiacibacter suaedae]